MRFEVCFCIEVGIIFEVSSVSKMPLVLKSYSVTTKFQKLHSPFKSLHSAPEELLHPALVFYFCSRASSIEMASVFQDRTETSH